MPSIDKEIIKILEPHFLKFMKICIKNEDIKEMVKDPSCEGDDDIVYFLNVYIQILLEHKQGVRLLYNRLVKGGYSEKLTKKFIYSVLKLKMKQKTNEWTWAEMDEFQIEYDNDIKITNYSIY